MMLSNTHQAIFQTLVNHKFGLKRDVFKIEIQRIPHLDEWRIYALVNEETYEILENISDIGDHDKVQKIATSLVDKIRTVLGVKK